MSDEQIGFIILFSCAFVIPAIFLGIQIIFSKNKQDREFETAKKIFQVAKETKKNVSGELYDLKRDLKKNKKNYAIFFLLMFSSVLGSALWGEAKGEWRDFGIIITVLSGVGFWVWGLKSKNEED